MEQPDIEELPDYEEMFQKLVEAMPIEKRLAGLRPEERLAGLDLPQVILALPFDVLRVLPEDYIRALPAVVQEQVRERLDGSSY